MFEERLCLACSDPLPRKKRLGAQYCSYDCKLAADATRKRLARFANHNLKRRELATHSYKLWLVGFEREVLGQAPRFADGYQLGAPIRGGGYLYWFPSSGAEGKKQRRTLSLSWAKAVDYFSLDPFEQPWIPKAGHYRLRYLVGGKAQHPDVSPSVFIPYGVPIWDLPFPADILETKRGPLGVVIVKQMK